MDLTKNQKEAIDFILKKKRCALFLPMGFGKTRVALETFKVLKDQNKVKKCLVITHKKIAEHTWLNEVSKFKNLSNIKVSEAIGSTPQKIKVLVKENYDLLVTNKEINLTKILKYIIDKDLKCKFQMLVIDESTIFKNTDSNRWRVLSKLKGFFKYIVLMTGTPLPNGPIDLYGQVFLLDNGVRLGVSFSNFRNFFYDKSPYCNFVYLEKQGALNSILNRISDLVFVRSNNDLLDNLKFKYENILIDLDPKLKKAYKLYNSKSILKYETVEDDILFGRILKYDKLLQILNGNVYDVDKKVLNIHNFKLLELKKYLKKINDNVIIVYRFKSDKDLLMKEIEGCQTLETNKEIENWNKGKIKYLLIHPLTGAYGLNLQTGGFRVLWYTLTFNLEHYKQLNNRLLRPGQTRDVIITNFVFKNTIDEILIKTLTKKDNIQNDSLIQLQNGLKDTKHNYFVNEEHSNGVGLLRNDGVLPNNHNKISKLLNKGMLFNFLKKEKLIEKEKIIVKKGLLDKKLKKVCKHLELLNNKIKILNKDITLDKLLRSRFSKKR